MPRHNRRNKGRDNGRWGSPRKRPEEARDETYDPPTGRRQPRQRDTVLAPSASLGDADTGAAAEARTCKGCREWYPDEFGGRGTCSHPGSGMLKPWSDTPACPFYAVRRFALREF